MVDQHKKVNKNDRTRSLRSFKTIEPNAAGIDLGSREHWVAGPPRDDDRPNVARFGTTTLNWYGLPIGSRSRASRPSPWKALGCTGYRSLRFWTALVSRLSWPTHANSAMFPAVKQT